jgi:magnesium chelatase family protein
VLFLDELPEFHRDVLEALREPLEDGVVTVARAASAAQFPARFQLVAAQNPCPCGFAGTKQPCRCGPGERMRYARRLSGPLLDRIDLNVRVERVPYEELAGRPAETSESVRRRILAARKVQRERSRTLNADLPSRLLRRTAALEPAADRLLSTAGEKLHLSARAYHRTLRVARTIADLGGNESISVAAVAEALQFRAETRYTAAG